MIKDIAGRIGFPDEAIASLSAVLDTIIAGGALPILYEAMDHWYMDDNADGWDAKMKDAVQKTGVNRYAADMVFLLLAAKPLAYLYHQKGIAEAVYWDTMKDLYYKLMECKKMYNVWGIFVAWWFPWYYQMKRFALGRMQYEKIEARFDDELLGVKKGDIVYNCHIPSSGPMTPESIDDSLRRAYEFYKPELKNGRMIVTCCSWLLYTPLVERYDKQSNTGKFHDRFHIAHIIHDEGNKNFWRVFNCPYSKEALDAAMAETSMQRALLDHLKNGGTMGEGVGYLVIDESF